MLNEILQKIQSGSFSTEEILKDIINDDKDSAEKIKMAEGVDYYGNEPDILDKDFRTYYVEKVQYKDDNKANNKVTNNFQKLLVDQKASFIAGNPIVLSVDNSAISDTQREKMIEDINSILGESFGDIVIDWITGTSNKGWEGMQAYIDEAGLFKYEIIPAQQLIPIYDTSHEKKINSVIRYYKVTVVDKESGKSKERYAAEWWDKYIVTYYIENEHGDYELDMSHEPNPAYHFYQYNTSKGIAKQKGLGWGEVPFIILPNNTNKTTDLESIKLYIDAYDSVSSGFLNDIDDIQMAIWILKGYEGTDLGEFMRNLKTFKAINIAADEHAGVESDRLEIPVEARKVMLELLDNKIYSIGQGVDLNKLVKNTSGVALKILYSGLDMKANSLIRKLKIGFESLLWFICEYLNRTEKLKYDYKDFTFVLNKSTIFNVKELCESVDKMSPFMSKQTAVANNPFVEDVEAELALMEKEAVAEADAYGGDIGKEKDEDTEED